MAETQQQRDPDSLWSFSLERYSRPSVRGAALSLQDELGVDVNLLFFCVWHAVSGRGRLGAGDFEAIESRVAPWRDGVTLPLRRLRNAIKHDPFLSTFADAMDTRQKILGAEIESERGAQHVIESSSRAPLPSTDGSAKAIAEQNLRAYLGSVNAELDADTTRHLQNFLDGVLC